ncbi:MAG TPA: hypothetical protein VFM19_10085 [Candidatus Limnocylindria bacterium]|nr:hypothetical protein [Candidatus Limnocylindria bacterium]
MRQRITDWTATFAMVALIPALAILMATMVLAAKPGSGATLRIEPNAAPAWGMATATGCGYSPGEVYLDVQKPAALAFMGTTPDADGCISLSFTTDEPGMYYVSTRQMIRNHWRTMATYTLPVQ